MIRIVTLLSGHGLTAIATLARNLILARLLGPESYGLAATIAVLVAAAEMSTTLGLPQLILSHKRGGSTRLQATLHSVQLARGVLGGALIFLCAKPLAAALGTPESASLFQATALVPAILGFTHLDAFRFQRHQHHLPQVLVLAVPALLSVLALGSTTITSFGPPAMLWVLLIQATATVAISHVITRKAYRLGHAISQAMLALKFGAPLAANGCLIFTVLHLEKLIAGIHLGLSDMGTLAMGLTLTLTPALISARCFQAYHLPKIRRTGGGVFGVSIVLAAALAVGLMMIIPLILPILGNSFFALHAYIPILSILAATRLPKSALATAALAQGRTHLPALANLPRLCAACVIWEVLENGGGLNAMLSIALIAEIIGIIIGLSFARQTHKGIKRGLPA